MKHTSTLLIAASILPGVLGAVIAAAPADAAPAASPVSAQDRQWLQTSVAGDIFEIRGGQIAEQKGQAQVIRSHGARLIADHTRSLSEARQVASQLGITVPSQPDAKMQAELNQFTATSGAAFDTLYAKTEVSDHEQDISEATTQISNGSNSQVKQLAQTDVPVLRTHLSLAQQAVAVVTGSTQQTCRPAPEGRPDRPRSCRTPPSPCSPPLARASSLSPSSDSVGALASSCGALEFMASEAPRL